MKRVIFTVLALGGLLAPAISEASTTVSTPLLVTATVVAFCTITSSPVAFGNYTGAALTGSGGLSVTCTSGTPYTLDLGIGNNYVAPNRRLVFSVTNFLNYNLYTNVGDTIIWGSGVTGGTTEAGTGTGLPQAYTVYGLIPASQAPAPGAYTDTVTASVTF